MIRDACVGDVALALVFAQTFDINTNAGHPSAVCRRDPGRIARQQGEGVPARGGGAGHGSLASGSDEICGKGGRVGGERPVVGILVVKGHVIQHNENRLIGSNVTQAMPDARRDVEVARAMEVEVQGKGLPMCGGLRTGIVEADAQVSPHGKDDVPLDVVAVHCVTSPGRSET